MSCDNFSLRSVIINGISFIIYPNMKFAAGFLGMSLLVGKHGASAATGDWRRDEHGSRLDTADSG